MFLCAIPSLEAWAEPGTPEGALRSHLWLAAHDLAARGPVERPFAALEAGRALSSLLTVPVPDREAARLAVLLAKAEHDFANALLGRLRARDRRETGINRRAPLARWQA
jgi:hypothetical protein